jgi:hypothetical protein
VLDDCVEPPKNGNHWWTLFVISLIKSLYGLKQAGYNWFAKLSNGLEDCVFVPSRVDPCIFFGKGCIVLTYVDNCIVVADSMNWIEELIQ